MLTGHDHFIRQINRMAVLRLLQAEGPRSRIRIATALDLNPSTVSSVVGELLAADVVQESGLDKSRGGRKGVLIRINESALVIGVDLGGTKIAGGVIDLTPSIRSRAVVKTPIDPKAIVDCVIGLVGELLSQPGVRARVKGIGIASPGLIDDEGVVVEASNLNWQDVPLRDLVIDAHGIPTVVENDANAGALAEKYYGAGVEAEHLLYIPIGTGVGCGIVAGGLLYRGLGAAGEVGHMRMIRGGPLCSCGRRGCLEALVSGPAIARRALELAPKYIDSDIARLCESRGSVTVEDIAQAPVDDPIARKILEEIGAYLGLAIGNLTNIFSPELVILGGGVAKVGNRLLDRIEREARKVIVRSNRRLRIVLSPLGDDSGLIGAASLVVHRLFSRMSITSTTGQG
jgi:glucokinase-like ROK family protein